MADDADYTYTIKTKADVSGARQQAEAVREINKATGESGRPTQDLAKEEAKLNDGKKDLIANLKALRHVHIPGVSEALHLLRHPVVAVAVAVGIGIEAWRKYIEKLKEAVAQSNAIADLIRPYKDFGSVAAQSAAEASAFAAKLSEIQENAHGAAEQIKKLGDAQTLQFELEKEKANASKALERVGVRQAAARGEISPVEAIARLRDIDLKYERQETETRLRQLEAQKRLQARSFEIVTGEKTLAEAQKSGADAQVDAIKHRREKQQITSQQADAVGKSRLEEIKKERDKLVAQEIDPFTTALTPELQAKRQEKIDELSREQDETIAAMERRKSGLEKIDIELKAATEKQSVVNARILELARKQEEYKAAWQSITETAKATREAVGVISPMREQEIRGEAESKIVEEGRKAAEARSHLLSEDFRNKTPSEMAEIRAKLDEANRTARDAAKEIGVTIMEIFKSINQQLKTQANRVDNVQ